mgnify:CR=1 FL=1
MPKLIVLPHPVICPDGVVLSTPVGASVVEALLAVDVAIPHACNMNCACTSCHVVIHEGAETVMPADDLEVQLTRNAYGFGPSSRLGCQLRMASAELVVELPG